MRVLSGIQPSGRLHLGNYFGAIRQHIALQQQQECFFFLADLHALTTVSDPAQLRQFSHLAAATYLALGLDPRKVTFFRQSDIPEVTDLYWILSNVTPMGLLERCHSYKDKLAQGIAPNHGLFSYPVLMAADILLYKADLVPVGQDQKQHIEVARDIAQKFNLAFGETLRVPQEMIVKETAIVPGLDGRKMSKSYGNTLELFLDDAELRKRVFAIKTDSAPVHQPKDPDQCNLFQIYRLFASPEEEAKKRQAYCGGGASYKEMKEELFELIRTFFAPHRARYQALLKDEAEVNRILREGGMKARLDASATLEAVKRAVGLLS